MPIRVHVPVILVLVALPLIAGGGCTRRTMEITSEPSGALVHLNDQQVGRTPVEMPFTFYGTYDVRLEREGYHPLWTEAKANPPWWELPGPDLIAEMIPGTHSRVHFHFELEPAPPAAEVDDAMLLDRAQQLRARLRSQDEPE